MVRRIKQALGDALRAGPGRIRVATFAARTSAGRKLSFFKQPTCSSELNDSLRFKAQARGGLIDRKLFQVRDPRFGSRGPQPAPCRTLEGVHH